MGRNNDDFLKIRSEKCGAVRHLGSPVPQVAAPHYALLAALQDFLRLRKKMGKKSFEKPIDFGDLKWYIRNIKSDQNERKRKR